jgi:hypothetical protein
MSIHARNNPGAARRERKIATNGGKPDARKLKRAIRQLELDLTCRLPEQKPRAPADPHARLISAAAVRAVTELHRLWPGNDLGYPMLRGMVVQAFYAELARQAGMRAAALELAMPEISEALGAMRAIIRALPLAELTPEHFGHVHETLSGHGLVDGKIAPNGGRRKGGVHFTPASLAAKVVDRTLEPLLKCIGEQSPLVLRVCDPSVGAGAFLLALVRLLAPIVLDRGEAASLDEAKRLVAIHCCYGVDKCRYAVHSAELALRLECRADRMPQDWLADNLKHGDALVGLKNELIEAFHWKQGAASQPWLEPLVKQAMNEAAAARQARIAAMSQAARGAA